MGFCLFNATAVAARWAQLARGAARVAILDWDVHHGNGTEAIFRDDASVLTISLHQDGAVSGRHRRGRHARRGASSTSRCRPGTGDAGYALAFERVVEPAIRAFAPDLLLIGAGQDAAASDPLGRMAVTVPGLPRRGPTARSRWRRSAAAGGSSRSSRAATRCATCRRPTSRSSRALAGLPPSFAVDPVGCDVPRRAARRRARRRRGGGW